MADAELVDELLAGPYPCCLTTLAPDGEPYSVVVWCARDGDRFTVNAADSRWLGNLRRDPRVSFVVVDTENILRHVSVDGVVAKVEPDRDYAHIDSLSQVYEGRRYSYSRPEDVPRFRVEIEPRRIRTVDIAPPADEPR
jgi:PPOX class probable F420-dependent enzyme